MVSHSDQNEREMFEKEILKVAVDSYGYRQNDALPQRILERMGNGEYCVEWVNGAFKGWQARAKLEVNNL